MLSGGLIELFTAIHSPDGYAPADRVFNDIYRLPKKLIDGDYAAS